MKIDLHNHTKLCNHAEGEEIEYIEKAIECGTEVFGFADHAPMDYDQNYRMQFEDMDHYEAKVICLKDKYSRQTNIKLGYEVDYLPGYIDERVLSRKVDYLIGSVHFLNGWGFDNPEFIGGYQNVDLDELWSNYFNTIAQMAKSQLFDIVGHIDLLKIFNFLPKKNIIDLAMYALSEIKKSGMAIEINAAGLRKDVKEQYPSVKILKEILNQNIPITFGSDAHSPKQVGFKRDELYQMVSDIGFKKVAFFQNRNIELVNF